MTIRIDNDVDLGWSQQGDFIIKSGDLGDTLGVQGKAFLQEVITRVQSSMNDWKTQPEMGANLDEFEGEPNNTESAEAIAASVKNTLIYDQFLSTTDFQCDVIPVSATTVAIQLNFLRILTNSSIDSKITLTFAYDLNGKGPFLVR